MGRVVRLADSCTRRSARRPARLRDRRLDRVNARREDGQDRHRVRATLARSPARGGHGLGAADPEHHGSARRTAWEEPAADSQPRLRLDREWRREDLYDPPPPRRALDERRPGDGARLRILVEARARPGSGRALRLHHVRDQGRPCLQRVQAELCPPAGQGRGKGARRVHDPRHPRAAPALVPVPARAQRLLRGPARHGRAVGEQVDGALAHRHQRSIPPRPLAARRRGRPGQVARLAQRGPRSDRERQVADHHERDDCGASVPGRSRRRAHHPDARSARHSALQGQARLLREPAARLVLRRLQPQEGHGRESAPSDGAGDRPSRDRRPREPLGRARPGLHAEGNPGLRLRSTRTPATCPHGTILPRPGR